MIFLAAIPTVWGFVAHEMPDSKIREAEVAFAAACEQDVAQLPQQGSGPTSQQVRAKRIGILGSALGCLLLTSMAAAMLLTAMRFADGLAARIAELRLHPEQHEIRAATSGIGFMRWFRLILGGYWLLASAICLIGSVYAVLFTVRALGGMAFPEDLLSTRHYLRVAEDLLSLAVTDHTANPWVSLFVRTCMGGYGCLYLALILASLCELGWQRHAHRVRCGTTEVGPPSRYGRLLQVVTVLAQNAKMPVPRLSVIEGNTVNAYSQQFGCLRASRWIVVTERAISVMGEDGPIIRALLGHELAHFKKGHVAILNVLRWLGRVSCAGDTFAFGFAGSFDYEIQADRAAVEEFGISRHAMRGCLELVRIKSIKSNGEMRDVGPPGAGDSIPRDATDSSSAHREPILRCFQTFLHQYMHPFNTAYWHPSLQERIELLGGEGLKS